MEKNYYKKEKQISKLNHLSLFFLRIYPAEWTLCRSVTPNQLPPPRQLQQLIGHVLAAWSKELTEAYRD